MKATILYGVLIVSILLSGCTQDRANDIDREIVCVIDQTDAMVLYPSAEEILAPVQLQTDPWQGIKITLTTISDKDINPETVLTLEKEQAWRGNLPIRKAKVRHFKEELHRFLAAMRKNSIAQHSIIFRAVAKQSNRLTKSTAKKRYLLVWSNLYEHNEMDFYDPIVINRMKSDPKNIQKQLVATFPLQNLKGINIWLLYQPASYKDNNGFMPIAAFYKHLFEAYGASVHIDNKFSIQ